MTSKDKAQSFNNCESRTTADLLVISNIAFLCLSKTWLPEYSPLATLNVPGYKIFRKDRLG